MGLVINTNTAATGAANALNHNTSQLNKSLARLSSGSRITSPADDAGGLAVSMRLDAAIRRTEAVNTNLNNAVSFLQTQDGALKSAGDILSRISELKVLHGDVTKSPADQAHYDTELAALQEQLGSLVDAKFNGNDLFGTDTLTVVTSEDGLQEMDIDLFDLETALTAITGATDLDDLSVEDVTDALNEVAGARADNGASTSRLQFASEMLVTNSTNLEAANSRIKDVDVAQESTQFARYNILQQSATAMLAQANAAPQSVLRLLG
ncbi:MAG: flagellin [Puniceicoccaceae bacterium]|nr:MAG: flagellin [Puniceicoccaceae bacterium]